MVSVEVGSAFNHDPSAAELAILGTWYDTIEDSLPTELQPAAKQWQQEEPGSRIKAFLRGWAKAIVIVISREQWVTPGRRPRDRNLGSYVQLAARTSKVVVELQAPRHDLLRNKQYII